MIDPFIRLKIIIDKYKDKTMKTSTILEEKMKYKREQIKELHLEIDDLWLEVCEAQKKEKEPSVAEKWTEKEFKDIYPGKDSSHMIVDYKTFYENIVSYSIKAHEAGQKHGAEQEREKHKIKVYKIPDGFQFPKPTYVMKNTESGIEFEVNGKPVEIKINPDSSLELQTDLIISVNGSPFTG